MDSAWYRADIVDCNLLDGHMKPKSRRNERLGSERKQAQCARSERRILRDVEEK